MRSGSPQYGHDTFHDMDMAACWIIIAALYLIGSQCKWLLLNAGNNN